MSKFENLAGKQFGYLTVLERDIDPKYKRVMWKCLCKCGNTTVVSACDLKSGHTCSCGCKKFESHNAKHGMNNTRLFHIWTCMNQRCSNPNNKSYPRYGGRGISVCKDWQHDFLAFYNWSMNNGYQDNLTIDRIDNNDNYCPENCRWADLKTQFNNRRTNVTYTHNGKTLTLAQWCEAYDVIYNTAWSRQYRAILRKGHCDFEDIFGSFRH